MEIRPKITILPADDPKKVKLGYKIYEIPCGEDARDYFKRTMTSEEFSKWEKETDPKQNQKTDRADEYRVYHHKEFPKNTSWSGTNIDVLEFLWGQPWNNLAVNFVSTLRPSCLRVVTNGATADSHPWRVTVWLEKNNITIKKIVQEVEIVTSGARNAHDLESQLRYQKKHGNLDGYGYYDNGIHIFNPDTVLEVPIEND